MIEKTFPYHTFRSFSDDLFLDPIYQKHLREKELISKMLKRKGRYNLILNRLGYQANAEQKIAFN